MAPILGILASSQQGSISNTSYESIATVTVGSGGASSITFSSIPSTYQHLQIRYFGKNVAANNTWYNLYVNFNSDSGSNYSRHLLAGDGTSLSAGAQTSQTKGYAGYFSSSSSSFFSGGIIDILDYTNTSKYKTIRSLAGVDLNGSGEIKFESSAWFSTSAINNISITSEGSYNIAQYSSFALYGIKG